MNEMFKNLSDFEDMEDELDDFEQAIPLMSEEEEKELSQSEIQPAYSAAEEYGALPRCGSPNHCG